MAKITGTAAKNGYGFYAILTETLGENYLSENTSTVKYEVYIVNGNKRTNSSNWTFNAKIDGSNVYNDTTAKLVTNDTDYNTAKKLFSGSEVIKHNSDGKKTITFSATLTKSSYGSYDPGKCSLSGTFKLTDIPRASTLTTANTYITFGESFRIDIDRKVNTYTDTITWVGYYPKDNGDGSYNLQSDTPSNIKGTIVEKTSESYVEWSIPDEVTSLIPTLRFVGVKLICTTYNGDTVIGTTEKWVYGRLLEDFSKPLINYTHKETYSRLINQIGNDNFSIPVLNLSQPKFTFGATPRYNATIKSINISCGDGQTSTTSPYTFNPIGNAIFTITAVDSRDYQTILVVDLSKNALPYIRPTIKTLEPTRLSPISGEIILNAKGSWYGGTMIDDIANPLYASYKCKVSGSDEDPILVDIPSDAITLDEERNEWSITNLNLGEITEYNKNYNFNLFISDYYIDLESSKLIRKGISTFNAGEKDFQVNGDLFVADEDGLNKVNVLERINANVPDVTKLSQDVINKIYPIGSTYIMPTNTSPASILGGTWELIDKEFIPASGNATFTRSSSSSATLAYARNGKNIYCRLTFVNSVTLNDTTATIGTISLSSLGITDLTYGKYAVGQSDGGGALLMMGIGNTGVVAVNDVIDKGGSNQVSSGATCYVEWNNTINISAMLDSACDKFYWKRTA